MADETQEITLADRIKGGIVGVCVADALGGPAQFKERGTFPPITGFRYIPEFDMPAGAWSDDGSLTLCLAQSLIHQKGKFVPADAVDKFSSWLERGYLSSSKTAWDVGMSTRITLKLWRGALAKAPAASDAVDVDAAQDEIDRKMKKEKYSGNGSLMRAAPIGLSMFHNPEAAVAAVRRQCDLTHPYPVCADACEVYTKLICRVMYGEKDKASLARDLAGYHIADPVLKERLAQYQRLEDWQAQPEVKIESSGWVVDTVEAALWVFFTTDDFSSAALTAANLGVDADTVAAVTGGLAGSYYGYSAIPQKWCQGLIKGDLVHKIADELANLPRSSGRYNFRRSPKKANGSTQLSNPSSSPHKRSPQSGKRKVRSPRKAGRGRARGLWSLCFEATPVEPGQ